MFIPFFFGSNVTLVADSFALYELPMREDYATVFSRFSSVIGDSSLVKHYLGKCRDAHYFSRRRFSLHSTKSGSVTVSTYSTMTRNCNNQVLNYVFRSVRLGRCITVISR